MKSSRNVLPSKLDIAIAASVVFLVMMTLSYYRAIDLDEGFYVIAVKLTAKQQIPYLDYFFNQAPFMPVVYGIWLDIFGSSWISLRLLSVLMGVSSGLIIFSYIYAETRSRLAAATALALYASCGYVLTWLTVVKPYSLATLFLVSAFATLCWPPVQPGASGLLSLAFSVALARRLAFMWALSYPFSPSGYWHLRVRTKAEFLGWFSFGFAAGFSPCIVLFLYSPDIFIFNNLGFHALRSGSGFIGDWQQKASTVFDVIFHPPTTGCS